MKAVLQKLVSSNKKQCLYSMQTCSRGFRPRSGMSWASFCGDATFVTFMAPAFFPPQVEKTNNRMKNLKRQLDEVDEECSREKAQRRKLQRELEEVQEFNEKLQSDLNAARSKLRWV